MDTLLFTAESGSAPGGQIAVASRSGSNRFHGDLFEFLSNDVFDAREPIDTLNPTKPSFRLNQFGGSLGGPIVHDRTFFYIIPSFVADSASTMAMASSTTRTCPSTMKLDSIH